MEGRAFNHANGGGWWRGWYYQSSSAGSGTAGQGNSGGAGESPSPYYGAVVVEDLQTQGVNGQSLAVMVVLEAKLLLLLLAVGHLQAVAVVCLSVLLQGLALEALDGGGHGADRGHQAAAGTANTGGGGGGGSSGITGKLALEVQE